MIALRRTGNSVAVMAMLCFLCRFTHIGAAPPPDLPGEEISRELFRRAIPRDTIGTQKVRPNKKDTLSWYDRAAKTWEAPPLTEQMSSDKSSVPMGMGGIFVPRFTESNDEPDVEIMTADGISIKGGEPGRTYSVEPGKYYVLIGSGSHRQRLVRQVEVIESKTTPVMPDWSGLTIETVDSTTIAFRGEYELLRIDEFEPYGRGFGADPELGEKAKTWILKPGTYKILGRGEGYNNLRNFITVRLLPGELVNVLLIQRPTDMAIISGGTVDVTPGKRIASHWKYGVNIGGNLQFTGEVDRKVEQNALNSVLSLRTGLWLRYNRLPFEWESNLLLDEGLNLSETDFKNVITAPDDFRIISLYIYRFLSWAGPYGRTELRTNLLPNRIKLDETKKEFCILNRNSTIDRFDSSTSFRNEPSFCPLKLDVDVGANVDMVNLRFLEFKLRGGVGSSLNDFPDRYEITTFGTVTLDEFSDTSRVRNSMIIHPLKATRTFEFGPQGSVTGNLRIGRFGTAGGELRIFAPIVPEMRFTRPDFDLTVTVSWRLARALTLDYDYTYTLKQPEDINARVDYSTHKIYLRFSYSNR
ncbi:MAG: hypothetical protein JW913_15740 [Chitinispirillaceae bacterium]|nr:hypothetical protein [Chitinispirillaceae bacterium]